MQSTVRELNAELDDKRDGKASNTVYVADARIVTLAQQFNQEM